MKQGAALSSLRFSREKRRLEPQIMIAPLVDVVFQLLIFFMLINRYVTPAIQVELPQSGASSLDTPKTRTITVTSDGSTYLDDKPAAIAEIREILLSEHAAGRTDSVHLRADRGTPFEIIVRVLDAVRYSGIADIAIDTGPLESAEP